MRRPFLLVLLVVALAVPAGTAHAQSNPFGPLPQGAPATPTPVATPASNADQSSVSRGFLLGIAGVVALVFVGIGVFITRDARAHLTDEDRLALEGIRADDGPKARTTTKAKARQKGKAQRQARKAQRRR